MSERHRFRVAGNVLAKINRKTRVDAMCAATI
jgi:hypothetical protein